MNRFDCDDTPSPWDTAVEVLMALMLLILPLAYGTTEAWSREIWFVLVAAMGGCVLLRRAVDRDASLVGSWTYLPIAAFVMLLLVQVARLPAGVTRVLSPAAMAMRAELLRDLSGVLAGPQTISLYAHATLEQLSCVLATATVFIVVLHVYRDPTRVRRLLLTITLVGLAVAAVAAYQDATHATLIYGIVPIGHHNAGPFQNYSHFSQFMNLSIGAALGLVLMTCAEWTAADSNPRAILDAVRQPTAWPVWAALALGLIGPVLVVWSMSRMGVISMLVAGGVSAVALGARTRQSNAPGGASFLFVGIGIAVFAAVLGFGFDTVFDRLATLRVGGGASGGRLEMLRNMLPIFRRFPLLGTGLGTHEFVFPMFNRLDLPLIATHAENEYAQTLEECGVVGLALALAFAVMIGVAYVRATRRPRWPVQFAAFGLGFGLVAIVLHSFSDFGQHVPADAVLTAVSAALLVNIAATISEKAPAAQGRPGRPALRFAAIGGFAVAATWVVSTGDTARRAEAAWADTQAAAAPLAKASWQGSDDDYRNLLSSAATAAALTPDNVTYRYWLDVCRWQAVGRNLDPQTHRPALNAEQIEFARQIADDFDAARLLCPTFGPPLGMAGQIRAVVLHDPRGDEQIRTAYRLTPFDPMVCRTAGVLAIRNGDAEASLIAMRRYLLLGGPRRDVIDTYLYAARPDLALQIAGDDRGELDHLATAANDPLIGDAARQRSAQSLMAAADRPDASGETLAARGRLAMTNRQYAAAADWLDRAVQTDYGRVDWRLDLARAQAAAGRKDEAVRQLDLCLRLRPRWAEAETLRAAYAGQNSVRATR